MKKVYLKPLLGGLGVGIVSYFTFGVFAQQVDVQTTFSQAAGFVAKLIISSESNQNGVKYIGVNENDNGNVEVYTGYTQIQKVGVGDAFVQQLGIRGGTFLRYGANHASSADEEIFLKYDALEPGIKWIGANYDNALVSINLGKDVNLDDVLVVKNSKVGVNNVDPQVALDIKGALKIGRLGSYNGNFYVGGDNLVYLDGNPIVPFYCGNSYVDSNYINPIGAPDNVDLEECDNGPTNGDGCNSQCQLELPNVTVSASSSFSDAGTLSTTISASTDSWSKLTSINYGDGNTDSLDSPERISFSTTKTYSTSAPDASWTITVYARNNLKEVRNDIGDNDTDRPTASASTTVRVCNPTACNGKDGIERVPSKDLDCKYAYKDYECDSGTCSWDGSSVVYKNKPNLIDCGDTYCDGDSVKIHQCMNGVCDSRYSRLVRICSDSCGSWGSCSCDGEKSRSCTSYSCSGGSCVRGSTYTDSTSCTPPSSCSSSSSSSSSNEGSSSSSSSCYVSDGCYEDCMEGENADSETCAQDCTICP